MIVLILNKKNNIKLLKIILETAIIIPFEISLDVIVYFFAKIKKTR